VSKTKTIARAIETLFSAYRRADYADAVGFVGQLGVVFEDYPESVIEAVTSPRTGLQRTCKFAPSIAEIAEACEREATDQHRARERRERFAGYTTAVPRPRGPTMGQRLCSKFGIRGIPEGWDALDVTRKAHEHGADFPRIVDEALKAQARSSSTRPTLSKIIQDATRAVQARQWSADADEPIRSAA